MKASLVSMLRCVDVLCGVGTLYLVLTAPTLLVGLREAVPLLVVGLGLSLLLAGHKLSAPRPPVAPIDRLDRIGPTDPFDHEDHRGGPHYPNAA